MTRTSLLSLCLCPILATACGSVTDNNIDSGNGGGGEEDSGAADDGATGEIDAAAPEVGLVFVTSSFHTADLGGLQGADQICNARAAAAALDGTFVAWLSAGLTNAADRLPANRGWQRVDGAVVAASLTQLLSGNLTTAIELDETGVVTNAEAWTATNPDGTREATGTCGDWTVSDSGQARTGSTTARNGEWTSVSSPGCGRVHRLYCFQI